MNPSSSHFKIRALRPKLLKLHEESIREAVEDMVRDLLTRRLQVRPILVDEETLVVLDGTHRVEALLEVGAKRVVACLVRYESDAITVGRWLRVYEKSNLAAIELLIKRWRMIRLPDIDQLFAALEARLYPFGAVIDGVAYASSLPFFSVVEAYHWERAAEEDLRSLGMVPLLVGDDEAPGYSVALYPPPLEKREVLMIALRGERLPPKSSRHSFTYKIEDVNYPLTKLLSPPDEH